MMAKYPQVQEWTGWIKVNQEELEWVEEGRRLPVPPYVDVMVKSSAGEYPDVETARFFSWEAEFGQYSLMYYKMRLH